MTQIHLQKLLTFLQQKKKKKKKINVFENIFDREADGALKNWALVSKPASSDSEIKQLTVPIVSYGHVLSILSI